MGMLGTPEALTEEGGGVGPRPGRALRWVTSPPLIPSVQGPGAAEFSSNGRPKFGKEWTRVECDTVYFIKPRDLWK